MPVMRFAQRLTGDRNVRLKPLIKIEPTNTIDITNNNPGDAARGLVLADKRYVSPFRLLNISATHSTARMILTSSRFLVVSLVVPKGLSLVVFIFISFF